ncbi:MAG: T9SS type A sorting domain-containing protein [Bacteroidetes bacterium]|nr:T9SS type A sorting domain-containing protein [Bacteroidota bacterium]
MECYLNGEKVNAELLTARNSSISSNNQQVDVYPNPTNGLISVLANEDAIVQVMDINGSVVYVQTSLMAGQKQEVNLQSLANGIYMIKIYNNNFVSLKKVVVNK